MCLFDKRARAHTHEISKRILYMMLMCLRLRDVKVSQQQQQHSVYIKCFVEHPRTLCLNMPFEKKLNAVHTQGRIRRVCNTF